MICSHLLTSLTKMMVMTVKTKILLDCPAESLASVYGGFVGVVELKAVGRRRRKEEGKTQMEISTPFYTQLRPSVILAKVKRKKEKSDVSIGVI